MKDGFINDTIFRYKGRAIFSMEGAIVIGSRKDSKGRKLNQGESQRKDGSYQYRYKDENGIRQTIYSSRLIASDRVVDNKKYDLSLREKEKIIIGNINDGISNVKCPKVSEYIQEYFDTKNNLSISTLNEYTYMFNSHVKNSDFGKKEIDKVKKSDVLKFYKGLSDKFDLKNGSINVIHHFLSPTFDLAVDENLIRKNPCKGCTKDYAQIDDAKERQPLTIRQQEIFLDFLKNSKTYSRYYTMVVYMIGTCSRISETIGITWDDIDLNKKEVSINHQLLYRKVDDEYKMYITTPKSRAGNRTIPLIDSVVEQLKTYRKEQKIVPMKPFEIDGYSNFVFKTKNGTPFKQHCIDHFLKRAVSSYNKKELELSKNEKREPELLPIISAHILRHTGCTRMAEKGMDIKVLQNIMGHADISTTMNVYNHVGKDRSQEEAIKIQDIVKVI